LVRVPTLLTLRTIAILSATSIRAATMRDSAQ